MAGETADVTSVLVMRRVCVLTFQRPGTTIGLLLFLLLHACCFDLFPVPFCNDSVGVYAMDVALNGNVLSVVGRIGRMCWLLVVLLCGCHSAPTVTSVAASAS